MIHRRLVILALLAAPAPALAAACRTPRILLVCPAGSVKSAIAREELKRLAAQQGVALVATSRGIHPEDHISPLLGQKLKADGINPAAEPLRAFSREDAERADILVTFDQAADAPGLEKARRWRVASWNEDYDTARSDTLKNIRQLLYEIKQHRC